MPCLPIWNSKLVVIVSGYDLTGKWLGVSSSCCSLCINIWGNSRKTLSVQWLLLTATNARVLVSGPDTLKRCLRCVLGDRWTGHCRCSGHGQGLQGCDRREHCGYRLLCGPPGMASSMGGGVPSRAGVGDVRHAGSPELQLLSCSWW